MLAGHQRLLPSMEASSSLDTAGTSSSFSTSAVVKPLQPASTSHAASPPEQIEDVAGSTMTIRGATALPMDSTSIPADSQIGSIPSLASSDLLKLVEPIKSIETKYQRAKSEETELDNELPRNTGTHRFTLVRSDAAALLNSKKASSCKYDLPLTNENECSVVAVTSGFAFAFLPRSLAPGNKCQVCSKRLGQRPTLQCDDCSGKFCGLQM